MLIVVTGGCIVSSFVLAAVLVPVPAMRGLGFQAAVLGGLNLVSMVLLFPAMLALDLRRVAAGRADVACCYSGASGANLWSRMKSWFFGSDVDGKNKIKEDRNVNLLHPVDEKMPSIATIAMAVNNAKSNNDQREDSVGSEESADWTSAYGRWLMKKPVKLLVWVVYLALMIAGVWGMVKLKDGLSLDEVVPRDTPVARFLEAQDNHFGFYNVYAVTKGNLEYPQVQALLYDYQKAFVGVGAIIKDDNGGLPEFWLPLFRTWLARLQDIYDDHLSEGRYKGQNDISEGGWHDNATSEGILAYKLMVQTGHVDYPVDVTLQHSNRLVDAHGIINPMAFYNYLSAWYSNDAMAYSFSQAAIRPRPREWVHNHLDAGLRIPKSAPIAYAQIPFYLSGLDSNDATVTAIREIRDLCDAFTARGLPNFPRGVPFTYWEQYLALRLWLFVALSCAVVCIFIIISAVFCSSRVGIFGAFPVLGLLVQLLGFMGIIDIGLSAIPAVILILAAGMGVHFTVHVLMVIFINLINHSFSCNN